MARRVVILSNKGQSPTIFASLYIPDEAVVRIDPQDPSDTYDPFHEGKAER